MSEFEKQVDYFKELELQEDGLVLLMDDPLLKMCGMWRASVLTRVSSYPFGSGWNELWDCVQINFSALADLADETENRTRFQIARLKELRAIYPDGTRSVMATRAIGKFMAGRLA